MNTLAIIPSRGGSTELKRKNLLPVDGTPMFLRSAQAARDAGCQVIVSTDDPEIRSTAIVAGFEVHDRGPELADCVVDEVVAAAAADWDGPVLLVQPTVQPITAQILTEFLGKVEGSPCSLMVENTHQINDTATIDPAWGWLRDRVNRQDIKTPLLQEVGVRWWQFVADNGNEPHYLVTASAPLVDIDTAADYRSVTIPKRIALWPIADKQHGMGHLRRCLAIAERLQHHDIIFIADDMDEASISIVQSRSWTMAPMEMIRPADLWILDRLSNDDMSHLPGTVVTFEDTSSYQADLTIDALYSDGADWCVLRPEFLAGDYRVRSRVKRVMLLFGGTDPSELGDRILGLVDDMNVSISRVLPVANVPVAEMMHEADLLITSAGRTVFEAAAVGVPTIVLAQNLREATHTHLGFEHGNVYLGLGKLVSDARIVDTVEILSKDIELRTELSMRGRPDGKGLDRIVHAIGGLLGGL